jgi:hypothetical protein
MSAIIPSSSSSYVQRLPQDMGRAAVTSFVVSFTVAALFTSMNLPFACTAGTLACAASLIDSLIRPLIQERSMQLYRDASRLPLLAIVTIVAFTALAGPIYGTTFSIPLSLICSIISIVGIVLAIK